MSAPSAVGIPWGTKSASNAKRDPTRGIMPAIHMQIES